MSNTAEIESLTQQANALTGVPGQEDKLDAIKKKLADSIHRAQEAYDVLRDKTVAGAKVTDQAVREHPYAAVAVAFTAGVVLGVLLARRDNN
jgi:ElaB/YqjD/DUF883 family membrane-anchored ribosome-binding protein